MHSGPSHYHLAATDANPGPLLIPALCQRIPSLKLPVHFQRQSLAHRLPVICDDFSIIQRRCCYLQATKAVHSLIQRTARAHLVGLLPSCRTYLAQWLLGMQLKLYAHEYRVLDEYLYEFLAVVC